MQQSRPIDELCAWIVMMRLDGKIHFWALYSEITYNPKYKYLANRVRSAVEQMRLDNETFVEFQQRRLNELLTIIEDERANTPQQPGTAA